MMLPVRWCSRFGIGKAEPLEAEGPDSRNLFGYHGLPMKEVVMSERVLLVDDEVDFLETLAERLRARGMDVATSTSAEEALAKVAEQAFDVVILDLKMPGMDGIQALKALKEQKPEVQVILLTGYATVSKGIEAMKIGATDFVEKPADIDALMEKIREAQAQKMILVEKKTEEKIRKIIMEKAW